MDIKCRDAILRVYFFLVLMRHLASNCFLYCRDTRVYFFLVLDAIPRLIFCRDAILRVYLYVDLDAIPRVYLFSDARYRVSTFFYANARITIFFLNQRPCQQKNEIGIRI